MAKSRKQDMAETSAGNTNLFNKGMVKDLTEIFISEGLWTHAVNAINNSHYGETGSIGNEPSNDLCITVPYTIIGFAHKPDSTEWVIFSTNDTDSEIGIFEQNTCSYRKVANDQCLGFRKTHIITAVAKKNTDCSYSVYWQDNLNPDRTLNLDNVPYICTPASDDPCDGEICTTDLDCEKLRLQPAVKQPCIKVQKAKGAGQLNNGSYMAVIAYSENGIKLTDYSIPSNPQALWRVEGQGSSLEVIIEDLDLEFDEYELVIVSVVTQQAIAKKIGNYSTRQNRVVLDIIQGSMETVPLVNIPIRSSFYERSERMVELNNYLVRIGVSTLPLFNYQPLANQIRAKWVAVEYDVNYYWDGGNNTGYYRDEVYAFFIRWVYKTGARSASYHIPGRAANASDLAPVSGPDVVYPNETQIWQVYDTSTVQPTTPVTQPDGGVIIAKGEMAYWESSERYPTDPEVWGPLCFQPIRHHKMPSNETTHIHNQGGGKINILGVEFENIQHPVDSNGNPIPDIVGYEILRGSREGNRSIVAKGIFANMLQFKIRSASNASTVTGLVQNYPYNDLRPDPFLTDDYGVLDTVSLGLTFEDDNFSGSSSNPESSSRLSTYKRDYLSFHSVETNFVRPSFGGNYIKLYTTEFGRSKGTFEIPYKHPKFKLLSEGALSLGLLVGVGIALVNALGKTTIGPQGATVTTGASFIANADYTSYSLASREGGPAAAITDLIGLSTIAASASITGTSALQFAGVVGGLLGMVTQAAFWIPQGIDAVLDVIYSLSNHRDYYVQFDSHGFYSNFTAVPNNSVPFGLRPCIRRDIVRDGIRYIGSGVQDFDANHRINNLFRTKFVCLRTRTNVPDPTVVDQSKARIKDVYQNNAGMTYKNPTGSEVVRQISSHYGAVKVDYENQYGQLESVVQIPVGSCLYPTLPLVGPTYNTDTLFGGDVYINRYTEKNPYFFFNTWLIDSLDGTEFDYTNHINGPAPRYYAIFNKFETSDFNIQFSWGGSGGSPGVTLSTPSAFYRFDEESFLQNNLRLIRKNCWAYLFYNGVRDYFTESELNMAFRDYGEQPGQKFYDVYGYSFNDLQTMFRSDLITIPTYYKYDLSLSTARLYYNLTKWGSILPRDYNPQLYETCFQYFPNRVVYSLQHKLGVKRDFWRDYLLLNFKDFNAKPSTIKTLNAQGAVILFEDAEPIQFVGVDQLQTSGASKITIGDGGLFAQNYQGLVNADDAMAYGSSTASRSAVNTPFGLFWISQKTGKIMQFGGSVEEISRNGMKYWFAEHLPSKLLEVYPDYPLYDNPVAGIGCQSIYDPTYELLYFTKKDYVPMRDDLFFDDPSGVPYYICGEITPGPNTVVVPEPTVDPSQCQDCPEGFELINNECVRETTVPAVYSGPLVTIEKGRKNQAFNKFGIRLYPDITNQTKPLKGVGPQSNYSVRATNGNGATIAPLANVKNRLWGSEDFSCGGSGAGRLNAAGIWPSDGDPSPPDNPSNVDICYNFCLNVSETRQYLIGIAGDNEVKIFIDGVLWVYLAARTSNDQPDNTNSRPFNHWHTFPVTLQEGVRNIRLCGRNHGALASFAAEVYELTLQDIQTNGLLTPNTSSDCGPVEADLEPYILFSTRDFIGENIPDPAGTGEYSCPGGGTVQSACDVPECVQREVLPAGSCVECTLFASAVNIAYGSPVTLFWTTSNAVSVEMNNGVGQVSANGSITVNPTDNTTYYIVATDSDGQTSVCSIDIIVNSVVTKCPCDYDDPNCFQPCDWTVSYDPKVKQWISFHDWKPSLMMPSYQNFYTIKDNGVWKHNDRWDSFCNYYGQDYFWEIEYPVVTPNNVTVLKSLEYTLDVYKFYNEGRDAFHVLDENFDRAIIYNSEQISGLLRLSIKGKNAPLDVIQTPTFNGTSLDIFFSKEENKFRFNQFWDITNDRGEFTGTKLPMWITKCSGYEREINPAYVDYNKPALEQKKFRHYGNKIILRKNRSLDNKMVFKITNSKNTYSPR
jgi:hypothetical protein